MRNYTFHFETETVLQQFCDALNNIIIKRFDADRVVGDQVAVNFVRLPKSRVLFDLVNKNQHFKMPCVSVSPTNIQRNSKRVVNKLDGSFFFNQSLPQPVPVDINVEVSFITRFQTDMDQIFTNFIPYTDPYFVVSWKWPGIDTNDIFEIRSHVLWDNNIQLQYPKDIAATDSYWLMANTTFKIESWMFKNTPPPGAPVYVINHSFTTVDEMSSYQLMKSYDEVSNTDSFITSAAPQLKNCAPYVGYIQNVPNTFNVVGYMLDYTDQVFLSSSSLGMFGSSTPTWTDYFTTSCFSASASYPGFSAVPLASSDWSVVDKNMLKFTFTPTATGFVDVICVNDAGYGKLTSGSIRPTFNPYISGTPDFNSYIEYQYPCVSGISIQSL